MPWRGPGYDGEVPTLGYEVLDWIETYLIVPDGPSAGEPLVLTREQAQFILNLYALDPTAHRPAVVGGAFVNARTVRRAVLSRSKGWGKSPINAALCIVEALAPVVPDGWDAAGEPVGRPWTSLGFKAKTQVVAASEDQTANTWDPLLEMCREGPVAREFPIEALEGFVNVPRGRIEFTTSNARSREGFRPVFAALDQTESWTPSIGGPRLAAAIRRNLVKTGGCSVETPNAFTPGEDSVAEKSWEAWQLQQAGKLKTSTGILFDHREAPAETDITDRDSLLAGFKIAYGDSVWVDPERVLADFWDPATDPQDGRRFFLNQITHAIDSWIAQPEWNARYDPDRIVADKELITLGFDGSIGRKRGKADATALVACCISDGHLFEPIAPSTVWEQRDDEKTWAAPKSEVHAAVKATFARYKVVGFYADPSHWGEDVARWEADYHKHLKVKVTQDRPVQWRTTQLTAMVRALEDLHSAIVAGEMTHSGSFALTRHFLNARRRPSRAGVLIAKEHPDSRNKIDAAYAATLAWKARQDAIAAGVGIVRKRAQIVRR